MLLCDGAVLDDHQRLHRVHCLGWESSRIQRVVRSTLSAEADSCSDGFDTLAWSRAVLTEILKPALSLRQVLLDRTVRTAVATDCKSLSDTITKERVMLSDKRLSLEASVLRQELRDTVIKWVRFEQMLADVLTKVLPGSYLRMCMAGCRWTLGPDDRAPSTRGRKRQVPDRVQTAQEADTMNNMLGKFLGNENNDLENAPDHHDVTEISTQLTDIYFNDNEIFCGYTDFGKYVLFMLGIAKDNADTVLRDPRYRCDSLRSRLRGLLL